MQPLVAAEPDLLRVATAGSVDDGKSTLIGRLLHDTKQVLEDQLEHVAAASRRLGREETDLALLTDGLRAEREQGITIDVAYRYFATAHRRFILADTPGHVRYTRNMVTGASTADVALVLVDARHGMVEQSRRHLFITSLVGVPHVVVCVNKMDLVGFSQARFDEITEAFTDFAARLDLASVTLIPMCALDGDNVVERSARMPWYEGAPLLYHLEHLYTASDRNLVDARFPVQLVIRPSSHEHHDHRAYAGQVAAGIWRVGDPVLVLPSGERSRVAAIEGLDGPVDEAFPPMAVSLRLEDDVDVARGDMLCRPRNRPTVQRDLEATVCWMGEQPARPGGRYLLKHATRWARADLESVRYRVDLDTLHRDEHAGRLELNDLGRVHLRTDAPLLFDDYRSSRATGSFILVDEVTYDTVAAGILSQSATGEEAGASGRAALHARSPDVVWDEPAIDRAGRWKALGQCGATVWLTGLPAAGKSTIAAALEKRLLELGRVAYRLDGDNLRHGLNGDLRFSPEDRSENIRRTGQVARLFADAGAVAIVSLVSPYTEDRDRIRALHADDDLPFFEVHVATPLEECERRDPKGLYARARAGELTTMTGIDDPYEPPAQPKLVLGPDLSIHAAVRALVALLTDERVL
jgi:bifunctional enzyme CysN/CysC